MLEHNMQHMYGFLTCVILLVSKRNWQVYRVFPGMGSTVEKAGAFPS